jgi:hypothetical protein
MNKKQIEKNRKEGQSVNRKTDRFYIGDVIKNKLTSKILEVCNIFYYNDEKDIESYELHEVGECEHLSRYIPGTAFNNWLKI